MSFTAVIYITAFDESPTRALNSILDNESKFRQTLIITKKKTNIHKKYESLNIEQHPSLKVANVSGSCILEIPPNCSFTSSTIEKIETKIEKSSFEKFVFHVPTITTVEPTMFSWSFYGLFLVSHVLQWIRQWWDKGMYERDDIVARLVITKGSTRFISKPNGYNVEQYIDDDTALVKQSNADFGYLFRHFNTHRNYGIYNWLMWIVMIFASIWVFFTYILVASGQIHTNVLLFIGVSLTIIYTCIVQLLSYRYIHIPGKLVLMVCLPLYLLVFPYAVFWYRLKIQKRK